MAFKKEIKSSPNLIFSINVCKGSDLGPTTYVLVKTLHNVLTCKIRAESTASHADVFQCLIFLNSSCGWLL